MRRRKKGVKGGDVWREDWHPAREGLGKEPPKQASCCRDIWRSGDLRTARLTGVYVRRTDAGGGLGDSKRGRKGRETWADRRVSGRVGEWADGHWKGRRRSQVR